MSFRDFKGIWWVGTAADGEELGHRVAIGGRPDQVTIICIDKEIAHAFGKARYNPELDRIEVEREDSKYMITMKKEITCRPLAPRGTGPGSWTAEDTAGGTYGHKGE